MTENAMTPADFAAISRNNNADGMFGGNSWAWIVVLFLFMWGRGGWGYGNGSEGGGATNGYILTSDFANIERKLDGINNGICDSTFQLNSNLNSNFRTIDNAICTLGYQALQNANAIQSQLANCCCTTQQNIERNTNQGILNTNQLSRQIADCCCAAEKESMQTRFDAQAYNCNTLQAIDKLGDRIIDYMANDKAQALRDENQALRLAASQSAQNQYIINSLRPMPIPSYPSCNPWAASYGYGNNCNNGCGCSNF